MKILPEISRVKFVRVGTLSAVAAVVSLKVSSAVFTSNLHKLAIGLTSNCYKLLCWWLKIKIGAKKYWLMF